jgi:Ser/Thr protein kinase RdoA (MazF antagonist)
MKKLTFIALLLTNLIFVDCKATENLPISTQEYVQQNIVDLAKQFRIDRSLSKKDEDIREKNILMTMSDSLTHYESDSVLKNVRQFLNDSLSLDLDNYEIINTMDTEFFGKSEAYVFLIKDSTDQLQYVVKTFPEPKTLDSRFMQEISAIDLVQQLQISNMVPIEQLAFAISSVGEKEWGLLLESVAKGKRLDEFVYDIAEQEIGSDQRLEHFEIAKKAFKRVGANFAQLHAKKASTITSIPPTLIEKIRTKLITIQDNKFVVETLSKYMEVSDFVNYVEGVKNKALEVSLRYTYVHGDAHLGNIFYDPTTDTGTLIDLAGMHRSIDMQGEPILHATVDFVRFIDSLRFKSMNKLTDEEEKALKASFFAGYEEAGGTIPEENLFDFYNMYVKLRRLASKCGYIAEQDPRIQASDKLIFEDAVHYFEEQILLQK